MREREGELAFIKHLRHVKSVLKTLLRGISLGSHHGLRGVEGDPSFPLCGWEKRGSEWGVDLPEFSYQIRPRPWPPTSLPSWQCRTISSVRLKIFLDFLLGPPPPHLPMAITCSKDSPPGLSNNPLLLLEMETPSTETTFKGLAEDGSPEEGRWDFNFSETNWEKGGKSCSYSVFQRWMEEGV